MAFTKSTQARHLLHPMSRATSQHPLLSGVRPVLTRDFGVAQNLTTHRRHAASQLASNRPPRTTSSHPIRDHDSFLVGQVPPGPRRRRAWWHDRVIAVLAMLRVVHDPTEPPPLPRLAVHADLPARCAVLHSWAHQLNVQVPFRRQRHRSTLPVLLRHRHTRSWLGVATTPRIRPRRDTPKVGPNQTVVLGSAAALPSTMSITRRASRSTSPVA